MVLQKAIIQRKTQIIYLKENIKHTFISALKFYNPNSLSTKRTTFALEKTLIQHKMLFHADMLYLLFTYLCRRTQQLISFIFIIFLLQSHFHFSIKIELHFVLHRESDLPNRKKNCRLKLLD